MKNKSLPKVVFYKNNLEEDIKSMNYFLIPGKNKPDWRDVIIKVYPPLKEIEGRSKEEVKEISRTFFKNFYKHYKKDIISSQEKFQREWNKINNQVMETLSEIMEIDWPNKDKEFKAFITIKPICPRDITHRSFDIAFFFNEKQMKDTVIHECSHFIYFEKWKKIFPKTKTREFDSPYLAWHLSEIVPGVVLNDKRIQKLFKNKFKSYDFYYQIKINGKDLIYHIQKIYDNKKDFEDFLRRSWDFVKKHEKEIRKGSR